MQILQQELLKDAKERMSRKNIETSAFIRMKTILSGNQGMELVQVAILVGLAVGLGLIFKSRITEFVTVTFDKLMSAGF